MLATLISLAPVAHVHEGILESIMKGTGVWHEIEETMELYDMLSHGHLQMGDPTAPHRRALLAADAPDTNKNRRLEGCPEGWVAAPADAAWGPNKCYKSITAGAKTLGECSAQCAEDGIAASPACIETDSELDWLMENVADGWLHWTGHVGGTDCIADGATQGVTANEEGFNGDRGIRPGELLRLEAEGFNGPPFYAHSNYKDLWQGADTYELIQCTIVGTRFISQHSGLEHNVSSTSPLWQGMRMTGVPWHPVPCDLGCRGSCVRCLAAGHDDWVPPNASCLCEGGAGPSAESQAFMDTFRERQDQHWITWGHEVVAYVLTRALWVGLLPSLAFALVMATMRLVRWASSFCGGGKDADAEASAAAPTEDGTTAGVTVSVPESSKVKSDAAAEGTEKKHHGLKRHNTGHGLKGQRRHSLRESRKKLDEMRAKAFTIRVRVSGVLVQVGFSCVVLTMTCFLNIGKWFKISPPNGGHMPLVGCALPIGLALMLLALFPIDATAIRVVCAMIFSLIAFIILFMGSFLLLDPHGPVQGYCHPEYGSAEACRNSIIIVGVILLGFIAACAALVPTLVCSCCSQKFAMAPRAALRRVWLVVRFFFVFLGLPAIAIGTMNSIGMMADREETCGIRGASDQVQEVENDQGKRECDFPPSAFPFEMAGFGLCWILVAAFSTARNRGRLHRWLINLGTKGDHQQEAAAIAALVSGSSAKDVLGEGARRFRALPLSALREEDMNSNQDTSMYGRTVGAALGAVDSFISHSWQDDGPAKFAQLTAWGAKQRGVADGKEPLVWLDKACIDQDNVDANLAALPVFLSGCRSLVVLAGPTYATRLWYAAVAPRRARDASEAAPLRQVRRRALHVPAHGRRPRVDPRLPPLARLEARQDSRQVRRPQGQVLLLARPREAPRGRRGRLRRRAAVQQAGPPHPRRQRRGDLRRAADGRRRQRRREQRAAAALGVEARARRARRQRRGPGGVEKHRRAYHVSPICPVVQCETRRLLL